MLRSWLPAGVDCHLIWPARLRADIAQVHFPPCDCQVSPRRLGGFVDGLLRELQPDLLWVDTFPRGVLGELAGLVWPGPRWLVARWIRRRYALRAEVVEAVRSYTRTLACERLPWPGGEELGPVLAPPPPERPRRGVLWLGSGDPAAQAEQLRFIQALQDQLTVAAPDLGHARDDVAELLAGAELVISAAGYNAYHQIAQAGTPAILWPQPRLYDNQFRRARGALGVELRAWHRIVRDYAGLERALLEWQRDRPPAAPGLALAHPERLLSDWR